GSITVRQSPRWSSCCIPPTALRQPHLLCHTLSPHLPGQYTVGGAACWSSGDTPNTPRGAKSCSVPCVIRQ
ncbi:unnamed protein product, partial [Closterium sp. Naga37s-1]